MSSNSNTTATMDSIKKKMQSMKVEKDNAIERAEAAEQAQKDLEDKLKVVCIYSLLVVSDFYHMNFPIFVVRRRKQYTTKENSTDRSRA